MKTLKYYPLIFLILASCNKVKQEDKPMAKLPPKKETIKIEWLAPKAATIEIDKNLSHQKGFECDSVIGVDYIGFEGEHSYYPVNNKGQFISTIKKKRKLNKDQFQTLKSILGNKETYENPSISFCYEPRLAFIYFKNNKVIGQTKICLSCSQIESTAITVDEDSDGLINQKATEELDELRKELGFN